ncbi:hypothetical protein [Mariniplasma anaerobium]|uniref:Uncharacterized protein n=1 Tax=Mariniplasma anaerobium TaxID=2735436 RepID=A0A7U9TGD7_9MOLU|nr:hypothetical protein [Mariniplasma anaerobium]BCR35584.1 hypothetical protein MPAN_004770 [Mariniplasma anaerobium]
MRKYNVFGKKLSKTKALPFMILIFIGVIVGYYLINYTQNIRLDELEENEIVLRNQINQILESEETESYLEIGELMPFIPVSYNAQAIQNDVTIARNLAGLTLAENFRTTLVNDVDSPFDEDQAENLKYVRISVSFTATDDTDAIDFMNQLLDLDHIYYISSVSASYLIDGGLQIEFIIYGFYYLI